MDIIGIVDISRLTDIQFEWRDICSACVELIINARIQPHICYKAIIRWWPPIYRRLLHKFGISLMYDFLVESPSITKFTYQLKNKFSADYFLKEIQVIHYCKLSLQL